MKKEKTFEEGLNEVYNIGKVQGRMELVKELIDLHDGGTEFLEALKEIQAKNGEMMNNIKKSM